MSSAAQANRGHLAIGVGTAVLGGLMALGATGIGGQAGYAGAGPAFLPWVVALTLVGLGALLVFKAVRAPAPMVEAPAFAPRWKAVAWVSVGVLLNAVLIEHIGFVASCALLFAFAARGFRLGADERPRLAGALSDFLIGLAISAPVFWVFTKVLGLSLPGLVKGGWI